MNFEEYIKFLKANNFKLKNIDSNQCVFSKEEKDGTELIVKVDFKTDTTTVVTIAPDEKLGACSGCVSYKESIPYLKKENKTFGFMKDVESVMPEITSFTLKELNFNTVELIDKCFKESVGTISMTEEGYGVFSYKKELSPDNTYISSVKDTITFNTKEELKELIEFFNNKNYMLNKEYKAVLKEVEKEKCSSYKLCNEGNFDKVKQEDTIEDLMKEYSEELSNNDIDKELPATREDIDDIYKELVSFKEALDYMLNRFEKIKTIL